MIKMWGDELNICVDGKRSETKGIVVKVETDNGFYMLPTPCDVIAWDAERDSSEAGSPEFYAVMKRVEAGDMTGFVVTTPPSLF
jgi:hypothetical protein